jgi:hypothetical protein
MEIHCSRSIGIYPRRNNPDLPPTDVWHAGRHGRQIALTHFLAFLYYLSNTSNQVTLRSLFLSSAINQAIFYRGFKPYRMQYQYVYPSAEGFLQDDTKQKERRYRND